MTKLSISARTHTGCIREHNEDSFIATGNAADENWVMPAESFELGDRCVVMVVADGMGGENAGEIASEIAVQSIKSFLQSKIADIKEPEEISGLLNAALLFANNKIRQTCIDRPEYIGMGTTGIVLAIYHDKLFCSWVGDSRLYRFSPHGRVTTHPYFVGQLELLSEDHSKVWGMVVQNEISLEEARVHPESNVITQSLGDIFRTPLPDSKVFPIFKDDILILCSDGLNAMLSDENIESIIKEYSNEPDILIEKLITETNNAGGHDNTTIIMCKIIEGVEYNKEIIKQHEGTSTERISTGKRKKISIPLLAGIITFLIFITALGLYLKKDLLASLLSPQKEENTEIPADSTKSELVKDSIGGTSDSLGNSTQKAREERENKEMNKDQ